MGLDFESDLPKFKIDMNTPPRDRFKEPTAYLMAEANREVTKPKNLVSSLFWSAVLKDQENQ